MILQFANLVIADLQPCSLGVNKTMKYGCYEQLIKDISLKVQLSPT